MEAALELVSRCDKRQEIRNLESHYISMIVRPVEEPAREAAFSSRQGLASTRTLAICNSSILQIPQIKICLLVKHGQVVRCSLLGRPDTRIYPYCPCLVKSLALSREDNSGKNYVHSRLVLGGPIENWKYLRFPPAAGKVKLQTACNHLSQEHTCSSFLFLSSLVSIPGLSRTAFLG